jgi:hypothetical protein
MMSSHAKAYVAGVLSVGVLALTITPWDLPATPRFLTYLMLALIAGTRKIRLPEMTGTFSMSFLFVLLGVADFTYMQTLALGSVSMLAQCLWKPRQPPTSVQVAFSVAALLASAGITYGAVHCLPAGTPLVLSLTFAGGLYFTLNTMLVAGVLALVGDLVFFKAWRPWLALFPYYLVGVAIAGVMSASNRDVDWRLSLLALPVMYLAFVWRRGCVENLATSRSNG